MDKQSRRELLRDYKEKKTATGVSKPGRITT